MTVVALLVLVFFSFFRAEGMELTNKRDRRTSTTLKAQRPNQPVEYLDEIATASDDPADAKSYIDQLAAGFTGGPGHKVRQGMMVQMEQPWKQTHQILRLQP